MTEKNATVTKPLLATVGAGDALYTAVNDAFAQVRERAAATEVQARVEEARERFANVPADVQDRFESLRERLSGLPSELPDDLAELREKFTAEELRALAEKYYRQALDLYADLAVRGEEAIERLRANQVVDERIGKVETLYGDAVSRAEDVLERVNGLLGRPVKAEVEVEADAVADPAPVVEAEVVEVTTEATPAPVTNGAPKKAPAKKAATPVAKKAPAKKAAPKKA
ncbi:MULTISPECIES: heparin-binding hemagglutinin [Nocardia]|uniref:Heparin-binding hemagglutinin n=1 Tax=Nocardia implantans TaxID=3108168 RepID=A0ABU6B4B5_9NOCA|nr:MULTISPECIES: heparin-binding hemagglutinin [unclassified Nocardia]MBF6196137.1 heparin-binding hemagglutinin [Nocardia beijingensis]MEA3532486.1 heparin-binding hemagglutinin [Nocardia sp. CDC192]MEB3514481.1 heparin-binding hemagglutinin [Nocardia sp. CDC186]